MTREQMLKIFADHGLSAINEETAIAIAVEICAVQEQEMSQIAGQLLHVITLCQRDSAKIAAVLSQLEKEI